MPRKALTVSSADHDAIVAEVVALIDEARRAAARTVNVIMTATYWRVGQAIVQREQRGAARADYGGGLLERLADALTARYGRGFSRRNLEQMRAFYLAWPKPQTVSALFGSAKKTQTPSALSKAEAAPFPLPWSHYVRLLSVKNENARAFYETEALRGGWTIRQLARQINTQFYERTALSRNKVAMLTKGAPSDAVSAEEELKDPFVLEFLGLKDEYSESELEEALIRHLEQFLLELGGDFAFVGRQRRLRVGDTWYRLDLLFFHRVLRCLVVIDLKLGAFTHADAGQMHLYLNYAREHWMRPGENPPVGLILCAEKDDAVARYALEGLPNKVLAAEYLTKLPRENVLVAELEKTRRRLCGTALSPVRSRRREPTMTAPRSLTAYHEAGHAILSAAINDWPEHVSVHGRDGTLGRSTQRMSGRATSLAQVYLAGFAAEHLVTGRRSRSLDVEIGLGVLAHLDPHLVETIDGVKGTDGFGAVRQVLRSGVRELEADMRVEIDHLYEVARESLAVVWPSVKAVAKALLEHEELDRAGLDEAIGGGDIFAPVFEVQRRYGLLPAFPATSITRAGWSSPATLAPPVAVGKPKAVRSSPVVAVSSGVGSAENMALRVEVPLARWFAS